MAELLFKKLLAFQYSVFIVLFDNLCYYMLYQFQIKIIGGRKKSHCFKVLGFYCSKSYSQREIRIFSPNDIIKVYLHTNNESHSKENRTKPLVFYILISEAHLPLCHVF